MSEAPRPAWPARRLIEIGAVVLVLAYGVFVLVVLPAGYGIDATGFGRATGLTRFHRLNHPPKIAPATEGGATSAETAPVIQRDTAFHVDEMDLSLPPGEGAEIKAMMSKGDRIVFSWTTDGGPVDFDMHGEAVDAQDDDYTSYWEDTQKAEGHGAFVAPFDGRHGWYWENQGKTPVTVRVKVAGWYEKLFKP